MRMCIWSSSSGHHRIKRAIFEKSSWIKGFWIFYLSIRDFFLTLHFRSNFFYDCCFFLTSMQKWNTGRLSINYDQNRNNNYLIFFLLQTYNPVIVFGGHIWVCSTAEINAPYADRTTVLIQFSSPEVRV